MTCTHSFSIEIWLYSFNCRMSCASHHRIGRVGRIEECTDWPQVYGHKYDPCRLCIYVIGSSTLLCLHSTLLCRTWATCPYKHGLCVCVCVHAIRICVCADVYTSSQRMHIFIHYLRVWNPGDRMSRPFLALFSILFRCWYLGSRQLANNIVVCLHTYLHVSLGF